MALMVGGEAVGYSYFVVEDHKAIIGDAYVRDEWASAATERLLMATTLEKSSSGAALPSLATTRLAEPMWL